MITITRIAARGWRVVAALSALLLTTSSAQAVLIANWSFESTTPNLSNSANFGPLASDFGTGIARGHHADAFTDWSSPTGNGSAHSWDASNWTIGDYYQFQISTLNLAGISLEFDQTRSSGGPANFVLQWSNDASTFNNVTAYSVIADDGSLGHPIWDPVTPASIYHYSFDLSSITDLNNHAAIYFRLTSLGNGGNVEETSRIDNVNIAVPENGPNAPEPSAFVLGGIAGLAGLVVARRSRRRTA